MRSIYDDERAKTLAERVCAYCGSVERLTLDHVIPRILGGSDDGANLVPACRSCNSSKGSTDLLFWCEQRDTFPALMLLRRYLKLVMAFCRSTGSLDLARHDVCTRELPFSIMKLPTDFPPLTDLRL
nr:HNH endonuclease signature motif containing protein [Polymorphobacter sp.]